MRPTFMGFETAKSAIFANQKSIDIMGNNLSNIDTAGYTRQRVDRASVSPSRYSSRVASNRTGLQGQGVETLGVSQMRDSMLDKRFRDEYTKANYHGKAADILNDIQSAMDGNDITDESGLYSAISQLSAALLDFTKNSTDQTEANIVMSSFKNMTQVLQQMDAKLQSVVNQQMNDLQVNVDRVNEISNQIAYLNKMIGDDPTVVLDGNEYFRPNELLDQRNLLLDELAGYGDISIEQLANGKVNVTMGGNKLVSQDKADGIQMLPPNEDGTVTLRWRGSGELLQLTGGTLKASTDFINGRGANMQSSTETPYQGIPYYRDQINTFAAGIVKLANTSIPEKDADGNITGYKTLLAAKMPDGSTNAKTHITAGNITISDEWVKNGAGYFVYDINETKEDYAMLISNRLTESPFTFETHGEKFTGTFADFELNFLGKLGSDLQYQQGRQEATGKVADDFLDRRDAISGVSQDEETADMMKYQKSYEAASRVMTVLDDLLDVIINRTGRAGL